MLRENPLCSVSEQYIRVLSIAGSDGSGGAGIQGDLKTLGALDCFGMSVLTAVIAQNTCGIIRMLPVSAAMVTLQLEAVLNDIGVDAIKIGALINPGIVNAVTKVLMHYRSVPLVLDPVLFSTSNHCLLKANALKKLKRLFPFVKVLTPNLGEASALLQWPVRTCQDMESAGEELLSMGCEAILVKGGHLKENPGWDCLVVKNQKPIWLKGDYVRTRNTHGTGCTYSSAIAAYLAKGKTVEEAVYMAKKYVQGAIAAGARYIVGKGHGPVNHYWRWK